MKMVAVSAIHKILPERKLMQAILVRAIADATSPRSLRGERADAEEWILTSWKGKEREEGYHYSFEHICLELGLQADCVRRQLANSATKVKLSKSRFTVIETEKRGRPIKQTKESTK